jgi:hypothetical protein
MKRETVQRIATPSAMLVAVPDALAGVCAEALGEGGLRVLRVGHVAAASERIPVVMPQLVVVSTAIRADEVEVIVDRCVAVGAEVIKLDPETNHAILTETLREAANAAFVRALRRGG